MNKTLKVATALIATILVAAPLTMSAQSSDDDQTDAAIGSDVTQEVIQKATGLPTSTSSAVTMGLEQATGLPLSVDSATAAGAEAAGLSEAAAAVIGSAVSGFIAASAPSSTATEEQDSPLLIQQQEQQAQEAAAAYQYYLNHAAEINRAMYQSLTSPPPGFRPDLPANTPHIEPCRVACNR